MYLNIAISSYPSSNNSFCLYDRASVAGMLDFGDRLTDNFCICNFSLEFDIVNGFTLMFLDCLKILLAVFGKLNSGDRNDCLLLSKSLLYESVSLYFIKKLI